MKSIPVQMPQMGQSIAEGTVVKWHKAVGDAVEADELLVEVESDKVAFEVGSPVSGVLTACLTAEGNVVEVGATIGVVETTDDAAAGMASNLAAAPGAAAREDTPTQPPPEPCDRPALKPAPESLPEIMRDWLSPSVARLALLNHVTMEELHDIRGSGIHGRLTRNDLLRYLSTRPPDGATAGRPPGPEYRAEDLRQQGKVVPMSAIRRTIADHMVQSIHTSAHVTMVHEVDATHIVELRERVKEEFSKRHGVRMTYTGVMMFVTARVLRKFPIINASIFGANILLREDIHIGCAVALPDESLVVPVIRNADQRSFPEITAELERLIKLARGRNLSRSDVEGGTFTISNFGTFGSLFGTPIINQPQVAILGMGAITKTPVARDGKCVIRDVMHLSFSFDHRVIDGAMGGRFLNALQESVESLGPADLDVEQLQ